MSSDPVTSGGDTATPTNGGVSGGGGLQMPPLAGCLGFAQLIDELEAKSAALRQENADLRQAAALSTNAGGLSAAYNDAAHQQRLAAHVLEESRLRDAQSAALVDELSTRVAEVAELVTFATSVMDSTAALQLGYYDAAGAAVAEAIGTAAAARASGAFTGDEAVASPEGDAASIAPGTVEESRRPTEHMSVQVGSAPQNDEVQPRSPGAAAVADVASMGVMTQCTSTLVHVGAQASALDAEIATEAQQQRRVEEHTLKRSVSSDRAETGGAVHHDTASGDAAADVSDGGLLSGSRGASSSPRSQSPSRDLHAQLARVEVEREASERARAAANAALAGLRIRLDESTKERMMLEVQLAEARQQQRAAEERERAAHVLAKTRITDTKRLQTKLTRATAELDELKSNIDRGFLHALPPSAPGQVTRGESSSPARGRSAASTSRSPARTAATQRAATHRHTSPADWSRPWREPPVASPSPPRVDAPVSHRGTQTAADDNIASSGRPRSPLPQPPAARRVSSSPVRSSSPATRTALQVLLEELGEADAAVSRILVEHGGVVDDELPQGEQAASPSPVRPRRAQLHSASVSDAASTTAMALSNDAARWMTQAFDQYLVSITAKQKLLSRFVARAQRDKFVSVAEELARLKDALIAEAVRVHERSVRAEHRRRRTSAPSVDRTVASP